MVGMKRLIYPAIRMAKQFPSTLASGIFGVCKLFKSIAGLVDTRRKKPGKSARTGRIWGGGRFLMPPPAFLNSFLAICFATLTRGNRFCGDNNKN